MTLLRLFREMCGVYYPNETLNEKRFMLSVDSENVPVFATTEHKVFIPQIQITPFLSDDEYFVDNKTTKSPGVEPFTNPNLDYIITDEDIYLKQARFHVDILAENASKVRSIKNSLVTRLRRFRGAKIHEFTDAENWTLNGTIYFSAQYNSAFLNILRVLDQNHPLTKVANSTLVTTTNGSWYLGADGFYVNPLTTLENLTFIELKYGEVFSDGYGMKEKGIKNISISDSSQGYDKNPELSRWMMVVTIKYTETEVKSVGRSFKGVEVNAQTD